MCQPILKLFADERGVTAVEYALIILLVVIGVVGFVSTIGQSTCRPFVQAANAMSSSP